jgi:hypothetical protein
LFSPYVAGICLTSSTATATESRNRIYNLTNLATGSPIIFGIDNYWGAAASNCNNNQITLTNGEPTDQEIGRKPAIFDNRESLDKSSMMMKETNPTVTKQNVNLENVNQQNINQQTLNLQNVNNVPPQIAQGCIKLITSSSGSNQIIEIEN